MICKKCGIEFIEKYSKYSNGDFCSRSCANSRTWSIGHRQKLSFTCKNSEKVLRENKSRSRCGKKIKKICPICKKEFEVWLSESKHIYCSKKCYREDRHCKYRRNSSGGFRIGSGRCNGGYYKNIYCHSTYELAFLIWNLDNGFNIKRCDKVFGYEYKNKNFKYFPDFEIDGIIYEIKGYWQEKVDYKVRSVRDKDLEIKVLYKADLLPLIDYVKGKYGVSKLEKLYEPIV